VPAVIGAGRRVYGLAAEPDAAHLQAEVSGGAEKPAGATAEAFAAALPELLSRGYRFVTLSQAQLQPS
jgi:hypothetical protein